MLFLDTHAGVGFYDLKSAVAQRSPEWQQGIARLAEVELSPEAAVLFGPYLDIALQGKSEFHLNVYPGSPYFARAILRPIDRMVLCELHPDDVGELRENMGRDKRVDVRAADGYAVIKALTPPLERRGFIFVDPPFEQQSEWEDMIGAINLALTKWPTGTYALWYPIKQGNEGGGIAKALNRAAIKNMLCVELLVQSTDAAGKHERKGLAGCGMLVINPPYVLAEEAEIMLPVLADVLSVGEASWRVDWIVQS